MDNTLKELLKISDSISRRMFRNNSKKLRMSSVDLDDVIQECRICTWKQYEKHKQDKHESELTKIIRYNVKICFIDILRRSDTTNKHDAIYHEKYLDNTILDHNNTNKESFYINLVKEELKEEYPTFYMRYILMLTIQEITNKTHRTKYSVRKSLTQIKNFIKRRISEQTKE